MQFANEKYFFYKLEIECICQNKFFYYLADAVVGNLVYWIVKLETCFVLIPFVLCLFIYTYINPQFIYYLSKKKQPVYYSVSDCKQSFIDHLLFTDISLFDISISEHGSDCFNLHDSCTWFRKVRISKKLTYKYKF